MQFFRNQNGRPIEHIMITSPIPRIKDNRHTPLNRLVKTSLRLKRRFSDWKATPLNHDDLNGIPMTNLTGSVETNTGLESYSERIQNIHDPGRLNKLCNICESARQGYDNEAFSTLDEIDRGRSKSESSCNHSRKRCNCLSHCALSTGGATLHTVELNDIHEVVIEECKHCFHCSDKDEDDVFGLVDKMTQTDDCVSDSGEVKTVIPAIRWIQQPCSGAGIDIRRQRFSFPTTRQCGCKEPVGHKKRSQHTGICPDCERVTLPNNLDFMNIPPRCTQCNQNTGATQTSPQSARLKPLTRDETTQTDDFYIVNDEHDQQGNLKQLSKQKRLNQFSGAESQEQLIPDDKDFAMVTKQIL